LIWNVNPAYYLWGIGGRNPSIYEKHLAISMLCLPLIHDSLSIIIWLIYYDWVPETSRSHVD
jgi:hypothetical protein